MLQYNELAKFCGSNTITTPPLSLSSALGHQESAATEYHAAADILQAKKDADSDLASQRVRAANQATLALRKTLPRRRVTASGVRIWSGPSADPSEQLHSISESPLERDFTIEGVPSKLGCPFASMAGKQLSSHAASVLSRYNSNPGRNSPVVVDEALSNASRVHGRESFSAKRDRRSSYPDPIKAEICGLSDHQVEDHESPMSERAMKEHLDKQESNDVGVCPIRFLDQHSPEEVATYFENHKHELPRSHEVCVKRYQSNEKQIRELDAKYGSLVSMIQGLGAKHKELLPEEPDDEPEAEPGQDSKDAEKVKQWARSLAADANVNDYAIEEDEDRQPRFERPLRDVRVGESPSRPWGISVPAKYHEKHGAPNETQVLSSLKESKASPATGGKCPFGFDKAAKTAESVTDKPTFTSPKAATGQENASAKQPNMMFTGPVFIGYSAEDAAKILGGNAMSTM